MAILRVYAKQSIQPLLRALGFFQGFGEGGHDFEDVADDAVIGDLENGGVRIFVDRHDGACVLHADDVLDRAADAERQVKFRRDGLARAAACGIFSGALMPRPIATINGACVKSTADFASLKRSSGFVRICSALTVTFTAFTSAFPEGCAANKSARNAPDWNEANHGAVPTKITSAAVLPWNICRTKTSLPPSLR